MTYSTFNRRYLKVSKNLSLEVVIYLDVDDTEWFTDALLKVPLLLLMVETLTSRSAFDTTKTERGTGRTKETSADTRRY